MRHSRRDQLLHRKGGGGGVQYRCLCGGRGGSMLRGGDVQYRVGGSYLSDSFL